MKCKQKLCNRNKNLEASGHCSVCENAIQESIKKVENERKHIKEKVEVDTELMIKIHKKLAQGIPVDKDVISNLLLGGVINILHQHDTIDNMASRLKAAEESSLGDKIRLESLENWVLRQSDELKNQNERLDKLKPNEPETKNKEDIENLDSPRKQLSLNCKHCDLTFTNACKFEQHLEDHGLERKYSCDVCGKNFHLKWRLQKHLQLHLPDSRARFCHYYNNGKTCPFFNFGCMFKHEKSGKCNVSMCSRKLCQFEHDEMGTSEEIITCDESDIEEEATSMSNIEYGENDCHLCTMKFNSIEDLTGHFQSNHQEYYEQVFEGAYQLGVKDAEENFQIFS